MVALGWGLVYWALAVPQPLQPLLEQVRLMFWGSR
jgi:hypothetical protein